MKCHNRLNWEEYAIGLAYIASLRSQDPYVKVGASALSHDNRVLGVAYNGLASGAELPIEIWKDRDKRRPYILHAEQNLLSLFKRKEAKLVALTLLPCSDCARLLCCWGVQKVCYISDYDRDLGSKDIFKFYKVDLLQVKNPLENKL